MKMKSKQVPKSTAKIKLRTKLIVAGAAVAFIGLAVFLIITYLNFGIQKTAFAASTNISGVINSYVRVTNINTGQRKFTVDNLSGSIADFAAGKTVMIYQVKGVTISTANNSTYGTFSSYNTGGNYELSIITSITGSGPYTIVVNTLSKTYSKTDFTQLISVPIYTNATVTGTVKAAAWSATNGTGGVVAFQVTGTLTLSSNVDVSGQGFAGGVVGGSDGSCPDNTTFTSTSNGLGAKGEGGSIDGNLYAIGPELNGGGGGNTHNAGGAGGGNHTYGGNGGQGYQPGGSCAVINAGGLGGKKFDYTSAAMAGKIFFGGGGGAGQENNGLGTSGANGGGIIVVRAQTVTSTCGSTYGFISDGLTAGNTGGNDGAGGGGAGGTIVLDITNYNLTCNISSHANGGAGGSVTDPASHGGGGGAGVGVIFETHPTSNPKVILASVIGANGKDCASCSTATGGPAESPSTSKLGVAAIPGTVAALPVELISFTGYVVDEGVQLNWATAMEKNNDYFTIERSFDGVKFDSIMSVPGAGNSESKLEYDAIDKYVAAPSVYYQLKQTDYDKKFTISKPIYLDTHSLQKETVRVYPNPVSSILHIVNEGDGGVSIQLRNQQGRVELTKDSEERDTELAVDNLPNGIYILETVANNKKQSHKIIIKH